MVDIHCHILWGVDDASRTVSQAIDMVQVAIQDGIDVIVATSHIKYPLYANTLESLQVAHQALLDEIKKRDLQIKIILGAENFVNHKTISLLDEGKFVTFNNDNKYMLIEFAWTKNTFDHPTTYIQKILNKGIIPIIAHPERYEWVHEDYTLVKQWRDMGALMQVNRTSVLSLDKMTQANIFAKRMLDDGLVNIIASDAHHPYPTRHPKLSDVYEYITKHYGAEKAYLYMVENPIKTIE